MECFVFLRAKLAVGANDFFESVIGLGGPGEGFQVWIMRSDVLVDGGDQFWNAVKDAVLQSVRRDAAEEVLDHFETGGGGWGEMDVEAGDFSGHSWTVGCGLGAYFCGPDAMPCRLASRGRSAAETEAIRCGCCRGHWTILSVKEVERSELLE